MRGKLSISRKAASKKKATPKKKAAPKKKATPKKKAIRKKKAAPKKIISSRKTEALSSPPQEDPRRTDLNTTNILLALRSVRDQSRDAKLDRDLRHKLFVLENDLINHLVEQREHQEGVGLLTVSVVGDFNSGKSTFINALLGINLCPVGDEPTTASITYFVHGDQERFEQKSADGTWVSIKKEEYRALASHKKEGDSEPHTFRISVNSPVLHHIRLVDTPGFQAPPPNANDTRVTEGAVKDSDVLFVLMDIQKGNPSATLLDQLDRLAQNSTNESRQPAFLLLNKAEGLSPSQCREVERECEESHKDRFLDVVLVSALQLNKAEGEKPLDALDSVMQRMRSAYKARDSFQENISAKRTAQSYQIDISGNVYDVSASSDFELASREQLAEMVKKVAAERHVLLEQQFQRHTLQLREAWQTMISELDLALKRAIDESSGSDESQNAREAIQKAENKTRNLVSEIFKDIPQKIVAKDQRTEKKRILSDTVYYQVRILDKASVVMGDHGNWRRIFGIYQRLLLNIERALNTNFVFTPQQIVKNLKDTFFEHLEDIFPEIIYNEVQETVQDFPKDEGENYIIDFLRGKFWQYEYEDSEYYRDKHYDGIISSFEAAGDIRSRLIIEKVIDQLTEAVISTTERNQVQIAEKAEELKRLQERINNMKEHTP